MRALGPLIPRVDEDHRIRPGPLGCRDCGGEPSPEGHRVPAVENVSGVATPRSIVPAGHDARVHSEPSRAYGAQVGTVGRRVEGVDVAGVPRRETRGEVLDRLQPDT